jgi:phosphomannomutase
MSIFKSYDIRGIYGKDWDNQDAYRIGVQLPALLGADNILIGRDARESSEEIFAALSRGILEAGCDVTDIGLCDTPAVYFATARYGFGGSVMITASHNPAQYNGLKISRHQAVPVGYESGLAELEKRVNRAATPAARKDKARKGRQSSLDIRRDYLKHLRPFGAGISGIKAVIDCSDGMAAVFIHDLIRGLDARVITIYDTPDGSFPHHPPNPLEEKNLSDLKQRTLAERADIGLCFDGDGDRVMFVDEQGRFVSPDLIIALLGLYFFSSPRREQGVGSGKVSYDVRSSRSVVDFIRALGGNPIICKVGHSHAKKLLREQDAIFGGELAGHYYFRDNYFCDSAHIAALLVLSILSREKVPFSALVSRIARYHFSGEINFRVTDKDKIIAAVLAEYQARPGAELTDIDGIRLDYPDWWFNLRKSNTEPYLRLVLETETKGTLAARTAELIARIKAVDPGATRE